MKLFGLEITKSKNKQDAVSLTSSKNTKPISSIPAIKPVVLNFAQAYSGGRGNFITPEYDLTEVGVIQDVDSYVSQAFSKKMGLMFKEGVAYRGSNKDTLQYVKARLQQISRANKIPEIELLKRMGQSLIRTSNAFLIKVRQTETSGGKERQLPLNGKKLKPVAAYFPAAPETMYADLDAGTGKIVKWRHMLPSGRYKDFNPEDVIHFTINKREGFIYGTPTLVPVIDDIRALRQIEENIETLLYQHLFPLFQYKVGTETNPAGYDEEGNKEVDVVKDQIRLMPMEGGIVTTERHDIKAVGSEGRAIRAEGYLEHFKRRVIAGLGISSIDVGEGDTSNRSCYSEDTETLTDSGWKYYWQIDTKVDRIATINPENGSLEYHLPEDKAYLYDYEGDMIHFNGRAVDTLVTPDHDMWVNLNPYSSPDKWKKCKAEDIQTRQFRFKVAADQCDIGEDIQYFDLPYVPYVYHTHYSNDKNFSIPMKDWLEFLGYFISEGTYGRIKSRYAVSISQSEKVNPEQTQKIRDCLTRLPFKFSEYTDIDGVVRFWIHCKSLYLYLFNEVGNYSYQKKIPHETLELNNQKLQILFDALMLGDGSFDKRVGRKNFSYYSSSNELINQIQSLCVRLGCRSIMNMGTKVNRLSITPTTTSQIKQEFVTIEKYKGKVYCFHVPNHLFVTRRNGKIGIHGNTAKTLSRALVDTVKDVQDTFEAQWNQEIIAELLLESTFDFDVLDKDSIVYLEFKEIDLENKIDMEEHHTMLWEKNGLTYTEYRERLGEEPIELPEDPNDQDVAKYKEWMETHHKLIDEPTNLIRGVDEPFSVPAQQAAETRALGTTNEQIEASKKAKEEAMKKEGAEQRKAQAQRKVTKDHYLREQFSLLEAETIDQLNKDLLHKKRVDYDYLLSKSRVWMTIVSDRYTSAANSRLVAGFNRESGGLAHKYPAELKLARDRVKNRIDRDLERLITHTIGLIKRRIDAVSSDVKLSEVNRLFVEQAHIAFDVSKYRLDFINNVEVRKAYNFGRVLGRQQSRIISVIPSDGCCEDCEAIAERIGETEYLDLTDVTPFHPGCECSLVIKSSNNSNPVL